MFEQNRSGESRVRWTGVCALICALTAAGAVCAAVEPASWPPASEPDRSSRIESADRLYLLSFENVALATVAEQVLGATLGASYALDPALAARTVSFEASDRMTPTQLLGAFEAALAEQGVKTTRVAGRLQLTSAGATARSAAPTVRGTRELSSARPTSLRVMVLAAVLQGVAAACGVALLVLSIFYLAPRFRRPRDPVGRFAGASNADDPRRAAVVEHLLRDSVPHPTALARARLIAARAGRPLEQVLNWAGVVSDQALAEAYAAKSNASIWSPDEKPPLESSGTSRIVDALGLRLALVGDDGVTLTVATDDPFDDEALGRVATATGRLVAIEVARSGELDRALGFASHEAATEPAAAVVHHAPPLALVDARPARASGLVFTRV